jgi:putative ABC transport system permease protein
MFSNYLITAWRGMMRNRMFAWVNIAGLTLAVAACLLIGLFILYEWSYDRQSPNASLIWRAYNETVTDGRVVTQDANTHAILGPSLKADLPEVVDFTRLYNHGQNWINVLRENVPHKITDAWMADPGFLRMFPQRFIAGDAATCLAEPYSVVLTQTTAAQLFGRKNPVGQVLRVPGGWFNGTYTVTAIVADPPPNTHLKFRLLGSYETRHAQGHQDSWSDYWDYTYFQLSPHADPAKVKRQFALYSDTHLKQEGIRLNMQPFTSIHLHSRLTYEIEPNSDARTIKTLAFIALFILSIAFINYINLTTARALLRAKEVGVRKVLGAHRRQLIGQFLLEGSFMSAIAIVLALILLWISLPFFEAFWGAPLINYPGFKHLFWALPPAIWVVGLVSACLYPAFALASFSPLTTLRGRLGLSGKNGVRRVLVVFQFSCATALLIGIVVIVQQLRFLRNHDKGLSLDQIIAIRLPESDWRQDSLNQQRILFFRQQIAQLAGVKTVAASSVVPGEGIATISGTSGGLFWTQKPELVAPATIYFYNTEPSFFATYAIRFVAGAPYEASSQQEASQHIIINESARRLFGFTDAQAAIGQEVAYRTNPGYSMAVHGVVADFHIESSKEPVRPTLYYCTPVVTNGYLSVKAGMADEKNVLKNMKRVWKQAFPESHFEYWFLSERFNRQYKAEAQLVLIVSGFTGFAIFIACLGLFGLAFITAAQRTKEIGVRKVLGASVAGIVALLSKDYLKLVLISVVIASPVAGWIMSRWLQHFAYRIDVAWWVFVLAGLTALSIALLTVGFQSIRAALANPVKSLRTE